MPDSAGSVLKFAGITHAGKAGTGAFKLSEAQLGWGATDGAAGTQSVVSFLGKDLASAEWQRVCGKGKGLLKLRFKGDNGVSRFAGFRQEDFAALKEHIQKHYGATLVEKPVSSKGWSWFDWNLEAGDLELHLTSEGKVGIDVPLEDLSQIATLGKNEINLEFQDEGNLGATDEVVHEMRLSLPIGDAALEMSAERLKEELQRRTGLSATGEALARIPDVTVVQPRGKHDFQFFQHVVKVHGKTQNYTVKYSSISKVMLLELPNDTSALVLHLDPPLRQGQQLLSFLVLTFDKERTMAVEMPEQLLKAMNLTAGELRPVSFLVVGLVNQLSKKPIITQATEFKTLLNKDGEGCVRCSVKTQAGFLFPTKRSMVFVTKPVIWIKYDEIEGIEFKTSPMRKSSFDLVVHTKRQQAQAYEFSQFERAKVLDALYQFFKKVEVRIMNPQDVESWLSGGSSTRSSVGKQSRGSLVAEDKSGEAEGKGDDYDEEGDEDFDEDEVAEEDDSSVEEDELEEDEPQAKRSRRSKG